MNPAAVVANATELDAFMQRHDRVMLQFSAGKDSAACLKLVRPWIDKVLLVWANPGHPYLETMMYMDRIRASVPHFVAVSGDVDAFHSKYGYPADSVPFESTPLGRMVSKHPGPPLVHVAECCGHNLWLLLRQAVDEHRECTGVIKGEKDCDELASRPRFVTVGTVEYHYPLSQWTDGDVFNYLEPDEVPASYKRGLQSSLDCQTCTAYLTHNPGRLDELQTISPEAWAEVKPILRYQRHKAMENLNALMREFPLG